MFDVEFSREHEGVVKTQGYRGVLCADGGFEIAAGPHDNLMESSDYLSRKLGRALRRLGYDTGGEIDVEVEVSPRTLRRMEGAPVMERKPFSGILGID